MILLAPNVLLRAFSFSDKESLIRHANNPKIAVNMRDGFPNPYTPESADNWLSVATKESQNIIFAIEVDGEVAGGIGVYPMDDVYKYCAEIGYWLSESHWNKGIITQAIKAVCEKVFRETGLLRLEAGVFSFNPPSMRALEKSGFRLESIQKNKVFKKGEIHDLHLYVKLWERPLL